MSPFCKRIEIQRHSTDRFRPKTVRTPTHLQKLYFHPQGEGGGGTQQSFIRGGSAPRSKPLPFYIPFLTEKVPLSYTFRRKWHPFHIPTERVLLNFSFEKALKILR